MWTRPCCCVSTLDPLHKLASVNPWFTDLLEFRIAGSIAVRNQVGKCVVYRLLIARACPLRLLQAALPLPVGPALLHIRPTEANLVLPHCDHPLFSRELSLYGQVKDAIRIELNMMFHRIAWIKKQHPSPD
jgi:hypothetical protein